MKDVLPFIIAGIVSGAVYGLAGTGLVLTYRTSGIFNFAHGAIAAAAAYIFYWLNVVDGVSWWIALILSVAVFGPMAGMGLSWLARELALQRPAMKIVGTVGVVLLIEGLADIKFGTDPVLQPNFFPHGQETFRFGGVNVSYEQLIVVVVACAAVVILYLLLRCSRLGTSMRAVVDDPDLLRLHGTSATRIRAMAWVAGTVFAALSGVLISPAVGIEAVLLTYLVVQAFGAAAVGGFASIPLTFVAGLLLGIASALSTKYTSNITWLAGLPDSLPFIVLFVVLLVTPQRRLETPSRPEKRPPLIWQAPTSARTALAVVVVVVLAMVPMFASTRLTSFTVGLTQAIMVLSLGLLVRNAGLVSLSQAGFAAIGAVSFAQFSTNLHLPWLLAMVLGALAVVPVAALLAVPTIRLSGLFLALATLGFGLMLERMFYPFSFMFTTNSIGRSMPRPSFAHGDRAYYFLVLAILVMVALIVEVIQRMRLGRMLGGMSDSPISLMTLGLSTTSVRIVVFCISGFVAGIGGILYGSTVHSAASADAPYSSFESLILLATLAIAPAQAPWYALIGFVAAVIPTYWHSGSAQSWLNAIFGLSAIVVAVKGGTPSAPAGIQRWVGRLFRGGTRTAADEKGDEAQPVGNVVRRTETVQAVEGLVVEDLTVRYGGDTAVHSLRLSVPLGRITGLIGPNGAGKTTTFNAVNGLTAPTSGRITLMGRDMSRSSASRRALAGLGRTFQVMQLCDSLTVEANVRLGCEAGQAGVKIRSQLVATRRDKQLASTRAKEALRMCGISDLAGRQAGSLSTGQRRLVDLARCVAGQFEILLLDEPSSGLDPSETRAMSEVLRRLVLEGNVGMLLVEHDMSLMMNLCDRIYVMDAGALIFEGAPDEVAASPLVQRAYLGSGVDAVHVVDSPAE